MLLAGALIKKKQRFRVSYGGAAVGGPLGPDLRYLRLRAAGFGILPEVFGIFWDDLRLGLC